MSNETDSHCTRQLQLQLNIVETFANEKYTIHPGKTKLVRMGAKAAHKLQSIDLELNNTKLPLSDSCTHLGIEKSAVCPRSSTVNTQLIDDRVKLGRATAFSLMGAGFCGARGLNPVVTREMVSLYITPRMLYGLETQILNRTQINILEDFYRSMLRQLQALPQHVAKEAIYLLLGMLPLEAILDMRTLKLLQKIASDPDSLLYQIAERQLAVKDINSHSWFIHTVKLCTKYGLPSPHEILRLQPSDTEWKKLSRERITEVWEQDLKASAAEKSTLRFLNLDHVSLSKPHHIWKAAMGCDRALEQATIKARFATGTYNLHGRRVHYQTPDSLPNCKLCKAAVETREHMLTCCPVLEETRIPLWEKVGKSGPPDVTVILDHSNHSEPDLPTEAATQLLCYRLHCHRLRELNSLKPP